MGQLLAINAKKKSKSGPLQAENRKWQIPAQFAERGSVIRCKQPKVLGLAKKSGTHLLFS